MGHADDWSTVSLTANALGLTARERFERFRPEAIAEMALRLAGGLMVATSTILWLILPVNEASGRIVSHGLLAALFTASGLCLYAFGTRGFRRQVSLDAKRKTLTLTKININEQGRMVRTLGLQQVESLFLWRPAARTGPAALYVRLRDHDAPILALTGHTEELQGVHRQLCDIIQRSGAEAEATPRPRRMKPDFARRLQAIRA